MDEHENVDHLQAGIAALKNGDKATARYHLQLALDADENEETAWLWLSGAVEHPADRRRCLHNVLELNPDSLAAKDGLARLGPGPVTPMAALHDEQDVSSPAAAILYPERHARRWRWRPPPEETAPAPLFEYKRESDYKDVWSQENDICGYCAAEVAFEMRRCPNCGRKLGFTRYRYPRPGADLYIYSTFILFLTQLYLYHVVVGFAAASWPARLAGIGLPLALLIVVIGLLNRWLWAFPASFGTLILLATAAFFAIEPQVLRNLQALPRFFYFIPPIVLAGSIATIFFGIFRITGDFDHVRDRHLARVDRGVNGSHDYYDRGRAYATRGLWATAVLHWQRAAAGDPSRVAYQRALAQGYMRLGFYERAADMLQSARRRTTHPDVLAELDALQRAIDRAGATGDNRATTSNV